MEDAALYSTHRNAERISNFVVVVSFNKHGKRYTELLGQPADGVADVLLTDLGSYRIVAVVLRGIDEVIVVRRISDGVLKFLPLVVVDEDIPHNGEQPAFDVGAFTKIVFVAKRLQEGILNEVVRIFCVFGKTECEATEKISVGGEEGVEFCCRHGFLGFVKSFTTKIKQNFSRSTKLFNFLTNILNKTS